jgi:hypothetical protein
MVSLIFDDEDAREFANVRLAIYGRDVSRRPSLRAQAKQSISPRKKEWIASSLCSSQ